MLTHDDVIATYQLILGRKPESDAMILQQIKDAKTFEGLRSILFTSKEFVKKARTDASVREALYPALLAMVPFRVPENAEKTRLANP